MKNETERSLCKFSFVIDSKKSSQRCQRFCNRERSIYCENVS